MIRAVAPKSHASGRVRPEGQIYDDKVTVEGSVDSLRFMSNERDAAIYLSDIFAGQRIDGAAWQRLSR